MSVTLTYESTLSRVRIDATGLASGDVAQFERSLDQVTWTTVRCGLDAPVVSGAATVYDYEFTSDVVNYYRVTVPASISFVAAGTAANANNASVSPGLPAGAVAGDLLLVVAAIRNSGAGTPNQPTGYTTLLDMSNVRLFGKVHSGSEVAPTVTFTGGVANADTTAQMAAFRNVPAALVAFGSQLNASAQNIATPAISFAQADRTLNVWIGWKQDDATSVDVVAGGTEIGEVSTTTGDDQLTVWDYRILSTAVTAVGARTFTVTGGASAISRGGVAVFQANRFSQTASITPVITTLWLKSIGRPFLNRSFDCVANIDPIQRDARHAIFEIIGRGLPVAVTDLRASRRTAVELVTRTTTQHTELDLILSLGEPMFVHTPANYPLPSMHVVIDTTNELRPLRSRPCGDDWRKFTLPLREVAAPGATVCGSTVTWQSVVNQYVSWQALQSGETSWLDLLTNVGTPADVIVP